jgi:hypothetical protein
MLMKNAKVACQQMREMEMVANDDQTSAMRVRAARDMEQWARSRAGQAGWEQVVMSAMAQAQQTLQAERPRMV